ncbi:hypothetical protein [Salmonella enterica]|uniref:hypothetical protein n=1 Tax=Salmonella enterica TaxID=28901 RepID=UPI0018CFE83B|nr:hypothetical protein [Salmonella enterica]EKO1022175.1 hypothetical protein [Salmonella enterica subsp. enterica]HCM6305670.1 hypothetical protein [Salmonella enterica subsp. enterica serovar 6,14:y:1,7]
MTTQPEVIRPPARTATDGNYCYIATVDPARTSTDGNYRDFLYSWAIAWKKSTSRHRAIL